jgi:signal transduction histidine kinase
MSPVEILKLVGFATGAVLHLYIAWLIWNRRLGSRQSLTQPERGFLVLGLCLGVWFLGNLLTTLHAILFITPRLTPLLRLWNTITIAGISLLPAALLHSHIAFWSAADEYRMLKPRQVRLAAILLYFPALALPYAVYRLWTGDYRPMLADLRPLLVPYSVWFVFALWASAAIDWAMKDRVPKWAARERVLFKRLAFLLVFIGAAEFVVVVILRSGQDDYPYVAYVLLSLLPTFTAAYHVYRYRLVEVIIKGSLVYAGFAIVFIAAYTFIVRFVDQFFVQHLDARPRVIEAILLLGMVALAGPLVRVIDRMVQALFAREISLYRDVVRQVSTGAAGFGELESLIHYTEETIRSGLDLTAVRIVSVDGRIESGPERRLAEKMAAWGVEVVERDQDLTETGASVVYALRREGELVGLMLITAEGRALSSEKRAILDVLAGQVAAEVATCRLVDEKIRLERELASRERLATLGQMAAAVAHEVKNPLSSIKSIAQVMREEPGLAPYDRDLGLIVGEIDRLSRTVSQLLAFSRPSSADPRPVELSDLLDSTLGLLKNEARDRDVALIAQTDARVTLTGAQAAALREAIGNLVLNAVQATEPGGEVVVGAMAEGPRLVLSVTDTGPGIDRETQRRVFEPFFTTKSRGTGLGLAIVQRRVAELGGTVDLASPVSGGRGTRFRVVVPIPST